MFAQNADFTQINYFVKNQLTNKFIKFIIFI